MHDAVHDAVTDSGHADRGLTHMRPSARGKFLFVGQKKLFVRGVTYGTFRPDARGDEFHDSAKVERDFAMMSARGINTVRTYTVPPTWLLDAAWREGLRVMVGLPWEQHVDFLADRRRTTDIERRVREGVRACAGHPAMLCYAVGNEIPAPIVRWLGRRRVERFIERLNDAAKEEDPGGLVTYVNYPTTEYLSLDFLDFVAFNVFLEAPDRLEAYLARLHNLVGERPLLVTELGLDSRRNGEDAQAAGARSQLRAAFGAGAAGAVVFSWTDEWHRGGHDIEDWSFGLTRRDRTPKPALAAVARGFAEVPFPPSARPRASVIVCSHNGARTIRETLTELQRLDYPDYEVIVVDDGSVDATAAIAREFPVRLVTTENRGLSSARNSGLAAARGEIVAYLDDDAYPDPDWLTYLAERFARSSHVGIGGPNLAPPDGLVASAVARAPGGPTHVLLSDCEAEHIPGCNMAFRREALQAVGGFDPQFRVAGDDVDMCWRLQERGWTLGFEPAAVVWHHRRSSVRAYLRQQVGYGVAEAMVERKWPEKYNAMGHLAWGGRIYASYLAAAMPWVRCRIYHGTWGAAPFQNTQPEPPSWLRSAVMLPEWYLVVAVLAGLSLGGAFWSPLLAFTPLLGIALGAPIVQAGLISMGDRGPRAPRGFARLRVGALTATLHLLQPLARLRGRFGFGLTPWRRTVSGFAWPWRRTHTIWTEQWRSAESRLHELESWLRRRRVATQRGGDYDVWDLEVRGGVVGAVRMLTAIEEHGGGRQLIRVRIWPRVSAPVGLVWALFAMLAAGAAYDGAVAVATGLGAVALFGLGTAVRDCGGAMAALSKAVDAEQGHDVLRARPTVRPHVEREVTIVAAAAGDRGSSAAAAVESVTRLPDGNVPTRSISDDGANRSVRP